MPKVSVLMPAYNAGKYIAESIGGILKQTFQDFELIIIDDCSSDNTWNIMQEYAKKDNRIIIFKNEKNLGIAGNRNRGVSLAKGEYVMWQDADDISVPERIGWQADYLDKNPEVGIVGGFLELFNDNGIIGVRKYFERDGDLRKIIFRYSPVAQPAAMIRRKCLDEVGEYDLKYPPAEDLDMSFRIGKNYKFANIQGIVLKYREHPNSATFTRLKKIEKDTLEIRKKYANGYGCKMTILDKVYNFLQLISIYIIPPKIKIGIFNFLRNSKKA